jgi:hypothetical protein
MQQIRRVRYGGAQAVGAGGGQMAQCVVEEMGTCKRAQAIGGVDSVRT